MSPAHRYEVRTWNRYRGADVVLPFVTFEAAHAEWAARCREGQQANLWQWLDASDGDPAGWDCMLVWSEYDDMIDEQIRRFDDDHEALLEAVRP